LPGITVPGDGEKDDYENEKKKTGNDETIHAIPPQGTTVRFIRDFLGMHYGARLSEIAKAHWEVKRLHQRKRGLAVTMLRTTFYYANGTSYPCHAVTDSNQNLYHRD
jgi:hypothetical protein